MVGTYTTRAVRAPHEQIPPLLITNLQQICLNAAGLRLDSFRQSPHRPVCIDAVYLANEWHYTLRQPFNVFVALIH